MAITAGSIFEELRRAVGGILGAVTLHVTTAAGDATSVISTRLRGGDNAHNGKWVQVYSGTVDGERQQASDYVQSTGDITTDDFTGIPGSGVSFELWEEWMPPQDVEGYLVQAQKDVTGRMFNPTEDISLHGDGKTTRFDIPLTFEQLSRIEYRASVVSAPVHDCDSVFDETIDADFTQALDDQDRKAGTSLRLTVALGASAGDFVTDVIGTLDMGKYTHLEGWIKSSVTLDAADYVIHLNDTAVLADGNDQESLNVPAVATALTWTYFRIALANPQNDTAIASVGFEMNVDKGAHTVWFDSIIAIDDDTEHWIKLAPRLWKIDKQARDLVLVNGGHREIGSRLMKLTGGDNPALFTIGGGSSGDSDVTEIPDSYLINKAAGLALRSRGGGPGTDPDDNRERARDFLAEAEREARRFPILVDKRDVT